MFADIKSQQDLKFEALSSAMNVIITQNQEIQKSIVSMNRQHEVLIQKTDSLEIENKECKARISVLENRVEILEKQTRCSTIEIRNIPKQEQENKQNVISIVQDIGSALGLASPIRGSEIREIYRTKNESIVVDFTSSGRKEAVVTGYRKLYKSRRENKEQQFNTSQINLPGAPRTIFISESLTGNARHVFFIARENVKNKKLIAAWTSYGKVYVKKDEGMAPARVDSEEALLKVISQ